jgi:hypothetical protein
MGKLIITVATTVDGVIDGFEWYVREGGHDQAGLEEFERAGAMLLGRQTCFASSGRSRARPSSRHSSGRSSRAGRRCS